MNASNKYMKMLLREARINWVPVVNKMRGFFFHIRAVHLDIIKVLFVHQLMHKWVVLKKKTILKFTLKFILKQLRHVWVLQLMDYFNDS